MEIQNFIIKKNEYLKVHLNYLIVIEYYTLERNLVSDTHKI